MFVVAVGVRRHHVPLISQKQLADLETRLIVQCDPHSNLIRLLFELLTKKIIK